ncbi:MAG: T9SS type A sorting domain-containing protein [candidate division WOR-3 bacterium]
MAILLIISLLQVLPNIEPAPLNPAYLFLTHDTGNCQLTVTAYGHIGFLSSQQTQGVGFKYPRAGVNWLFFGGMALGNSRTYVADAFFGLNQVDSRDFTIVESLDYYNRLGLEEYRGVMRDGAHPTPKNIRVEQYSVATADPRYDDGVIIEYTYTNVGTEPVNGLYAGIFIDFDMGAANTNQAGTDTARRVVWMRQSTSDNPTVGIKILYPNSWANLYCTDHDTFVYPVQGMHDTVKYKIMAGLYRKYASNRNYDWSVCASVGPFDLAPDQSYKCAFAILGGTSLALFYENCDSLQSFYNQYLGIAGEPINKNIPTLTVFPNPFRSDAQISLSLPKEEFFSLSLYDVSGKLVENLYSGKGKYYTGKLNKNYPSGVYFLHLKGNETNRTWKVICEK